jgi:hypothetical protein
MCLCKQCGNILFISSYYCYVNINILFLARRKELTHLIGWGLGSLALPQDLLALPHCN